MKNLINKLKTYSSNTQKSIKFIAKYFIFLPIKILIGLIFITGIVVSCSVKSATPWEQIPFTKDPTVEDIYCLQNNLTCHPTLQSAANSKAQIESEMHQNYGGNDAICTATGGIIVSDSLPFTVKVEYDCTFDNYGTPFNYQSAGSVEGVVFSTGNACHNPNYGVEIDENNDGVTDSCHRPQCPTSNSTNSEYDFVISRSGGSPTPDQVTAHSQKCMPVGHGGVYCVVEATEHIDQTGFSNTYYTQENSGTHASTGQVCGDLTPWSGDAQGTTSEGSEQADFCFFAGGTMNCYRDPDEVCPDGNCQAGCASIGGEAWCIESGQTSDGSGNPSNPPDGFGSGGAGTGDTSNGDGGNGDEAPDTGDGGGNGGGGNDDNPDDSDPNPECEPTANTNCGSNDFYDANNWDEKNFGTVLTAFQDRVLSSQVGTATANFFTITTSGTCEVWSVTTSAFTVTFDQHCSQIMQSIFPFVSAVIIALASFVAFRWSFL